MPQVRRRSRKAADVVVQLVSEVVLLRMRSRRPLVAVPEELDGAAVTERQIQFLLALAAFSVLVAFVCGVLVGANAK